MISEISALARSLLEAAQKATPGPWRNIDGYLGISGRLNQQIESAGRAGIAAVTKPDDAAYIALCSPDAIVRLAEWSLALLAENDRLEDRNYFERQTRCRHNAKAIERAEQEAVRLRKALRQMLEREHAHAEGSHVENCGSVLDRARAALAEGKPEPPPSEKEVAP